MRIDIITIFPEAMEPYLHTSILKRAQEKRRVTFRVHDLRQWGLGKRRTLDDKPYGGGAGMVLVIEPIYRSLRSLKIPNLKFSARGGSASGGQIPNKSKAPNSKPRNRTRVILTSAKGRLFTQRDAERYAKRYDRLVILAGHYEGVDERVAKYLADEEVSIGPYVLTGGELPALVIADAVTRLLPGVLGNASSLRDESYQLPATSTKQQNRTTSARLQPRRLRIGIPTAASGLAAGSWQLEPPHYTRPADFSPRRGIHWRVPKILLSGDHAAITQWRDRQRRKTSSA